MDLSLSPNAQKLRSELLRFMEESVYPNEGTFHAQSESMENRHSCPPILKSLKHEARSRGLWNLFLPDAERGAGLSNVDYAHLCEIMGRSPLVAPESCNCNAPDTGNMEVLHLFGTPEQQRQWLEPLLEGEIRSAFFMTEPDVASSDARNIQSSIVRDGDEYIINGRKWWSSGAAAPDCKIGIFMGITDPDADPYRQQSMVLVPTETPGVEVVRELPVFGAFHGRGGHPEVRFSQVRIPVSNLLASEGDGFAIAQARLGPGRIHHCMRLIGMAERGLELACRRALSRKAFGKQLAQQGKIQAWIAQARIRIEQARLLTLKTAYLMDTVGNKEARMEVSAIKVAVPSMAEWVLDKAIQIHGGMGFTNDTPRAMMWSHARTMRMADGPDEVHEMAMARRELARYPES